MSPIGARALEKSWTVGTMASDVRFRLRTAGIESAEQEVAWLLEHALGLSVLRQAVNRNRLLSAEESALVRESVARRAAREPLQYILGTQEFCGLEFEVNPSVLIPRPETELMLPSVVRRLPAEGRPVVVDVGTGSGCLAVTLARTVPHARILATDLSRAALDVARRNADRHGVISALTWLQGDLLKPLDGHGLERTVSVIVSNPPYLSESDWLTLQPEVRLFEPRSALIAGPRGTELHERLLAQAIPFLKPGGFLIMELGQGQGESLVELVKADPAYQAVETICDDANIERVFIAQRAGD